MELKLINSVNNFWVSARNIHMGNIVCFHVKVCFQQIFFAVCQILYCRKPATCHLWQVFSSKLRYFLNSVFFIFHWFLLFIYSQKAFSSASLPHCWDSNYNAECWGTESNLSAKGQFRAGQASGLISGRSFYCASGTGKDGTNQSYYLCTSFRACLSHYRLKVDYKT